MKKHDIKHIFTAPHNPTGNSVLERINREISVALRISRGNNIKTTTMNIWTRLNLTNNSSIGYAPYEVYFNKPVINTKDNEFKIDYDEIKKKLTKKREIWNKRKIKDHVEFQIGDLVYKKIFNQDKIVTKFE
ncbi:hypothetical protein DMUE_3114 [Dictyocoela muelleri]|nr:hypothetical protein DMUE_3114 [Dictyocoela muelleri]